MDFQNGQYISAYTENDKIFEGKIYTREDGTQVALNEDKKWIPVSKLKLIRVVESENDDNDIGSLVNNDFEEHDLDIDKLSSLEDTKLEKVGDDREKELVSSGIKLNPGEYKDAFVSKVKSEKIAKDANAGNISVTKALEKYKQSKDADIKMRVEKSLKESFNDNSIELDDILDDDLFENDYDENVYDATEDSDFDDDYFENMASEFEEIYDSDLEDDFSDDDELDSDLVYKGTEDENTTEDAEAAIESEIDKYADSVEVYNDKEMFEHLCKKFNVDSKKLLKENNHSIADSILAMAKQIKL